MEIPVKKNNFLYLTVLASLLFLTFSPLNSVISLTIFIFTYIFVVQQNKYFIYFYPFMIYPFMFLIKVQNVENIFSSILPDLLVVFSIAYHCLFFQFRKRFWFFYIVLLIYACLVFIFLMFSLNDLNYIFIVVRQFILPLAFLIVFVDISQRKLDIPLQALSISIMFFSFVCLLSILNIFGFLPIQGDIPELSPFLHFSNSEADVLKFSGREIFGLNIPRLNTFTGGAIGSASAILFYLGLLSIFSLNKQMYIFKICGFFLLLASAMTVSNSILFSIIIFVSINYLIYKKYLLVLLAILLAILFMFSATSYVGSPIEYFKETSLSGFIIYLQDADPIDYLIGIGPRLVSQGFEFVPEGFVIDAGILRVFIETGIITFMLFLYFNYLVLRLAIKNFSSSRKELNIYLSIFILFLVLIHGNITILPPFYPIYCLAVAGIISLSINNKKSLD
jgi:hypothetical protein